MCDTQKALTDSELNLIVECVKHSIVNNHKWASEYIRTLIDAFDDSITNAEKCKCLSAIMYTVKSNMDHLTNLETILSKLKDSYL